MNLLLHSPWFSTQASYTKITTTAGRPVGATETSGFASDAGYFYSRTTRW